jgi:hypothetical protein
LTNSPCKTASRRPFVARPLVVSSCRMVAALTLVVPPSRPLIVPHPRPSNVPPHRRHCTPSSPSTAAAKLPPTSRCRAAAKLPPTSAFALPPPPQLPPPPRRRQAAADLALSRCRRRRAAVRWLVVVLLSAVRFRHRMPSCDRGLAPRVHFCLHLGEDWRIFSGFFSVCRFVDSICRTNRTSTCKFYLSNK